MRNKLIIANWKMHGNLQELQKLSNQICDIITTQQIIILIPFIYITNLAKQFLKHKIAIGAQNLAAFTNGAYTGEISASMLLDIQCQYVLVGHSERKIYFKEDNLSLQKKFQLAITHHLKPILCIGETLSETHEREKILAQQLDDILQNNINLQANQFIIAYEPVWAIGSGKSANIDDLNNVFDILRQYLTKKFSLDFAKKIKIIYGGSVNSSNIVSLLQQKNIDGVLIGNASLKITEFKKILELIIKY